MVALDKNMMTTLFFLTGVMVTVGNALASGDQLDHVHRKKMKAYNLIFELLSVLTRLTAGYDGTAEVDAPTLQREQDVKSMIPTLLLISEISTPAYF